MRARRGGISTKNFDESLLHLAPLASQLWGEPEFQSPPELGDLGGKKVSAQDLRRHARYSGIGAKAPHREEDKLIVLLSLSR
jgi:hypothetical protein